jgi:hypothetical protein
MCEGNTAYMVHIWFHSSMSPHVTNQIWTCCEKLPKYREQISKPFVCWFKLYLHLNILLNRPQFTALSLPANCYISQVFHSEHSSGYKKEDGMVLHQCTTSCGNSTLHILPTHSTQLLFWSHNNFAIWAAILSFFVYTRLCAMSSTVNFYVSTTITWRMKHFFASDSIPYSLISQYLHHMWCEPEVISFLLPNNLVYEMLPLT